MVLPLTVIGVALFYLGAIPIRFALRLTWDGRFIIGTGIAIFEPRFAQRRALKPKAAKKPSISIENLDLPRLLRAGLRALKHILYHLPPGGVTLEGILGTPDAALTALVCGSVNSLGHALHGISGDGIRIDLKPDFSVEHVHLEVSGMISARAGHIMLAALLGAFEYASGRFNQWISTPLKAS